MKRTNGYTKIYDLYATLTALRNVDPEKEDGSVYAAFTKLRYEMQVFGPHIVVLSLEMSEKRKIHTFKLVSRSSSNWRQQ